MDFIPEKPALEVDEIRESGRAAGCCSSRPGDEGMGGESTIEDADGEVPFPITASEEEEPALMHAVVDEELRPPIAEVTYPLAVVVDLNAVLGLVNAALPQRSISHLLAFHRFHELRWKAEEVFGPGEYQDYEGGPPLGRGVRQRLERWSHRPKLRWAGQRRDRRAGSHEARGSSAEGSKGFLILAARWPSAAAGVVFLPLPLGRPGPRLFGTPSPPRARAAPAAAVLVGAAAAMAARAARVFWLRLPFGRPHF
jgi:hypothetical protein